MPIPPLPWLPEIPASDGQAKSDLEKALYQKQLDIAETIEVTRADTATSVENARLDKADEVKAARVDADIAEEVALRKSIHDAYVDVCKASMDRSLTRATFLTSAITAVATVYTTLIGASYAAAAAGRALPARAVIPAVFLALAFVCSAFYVAFLHEHARDRVLIPSGIGGLVAEARLINFIEWTAAGVFDRAAAVRTAIIAFAIGVVLMPIPFVAMSNLVGFGLGVVGLIGIGVWVRIGEPRMRRPTPPGVVDPPALA